MHVVQIFLECQLADILARTEDSFAGDCMRVSIGFNMPLLARRTFRRISEAIPTTPAGVKYLFIIAKSLLAKGLQRFFQNASSTRGQLR
jgi:hypothetical protein